MNEMCYTKKSHSLQSSWEMSCKERLGLNVYAGYRRASIHGHHIHISMQGVFIVSYAASNHHITFIVSYLPDYC